jgi:hypothetical protein
MNYNLLIRDDIDDENIDMDIIDGGDDENDFLARFSSYVSSDANIKGAFEEEKEKGYIVNLEDDDEEEKEYIVNLEDDEEEEKEYIVNLDDKEDDDDISLDENVVLDDKEDSEYITPDDKEADEYIVNLKDEDNDDIPLDDNVFDEDEVITVVGSSEFSELNDMLSKYSEFVYE